MVWEPDTFVWNIFNIHLYFMKVNLVPPELNVRDFARALRDCRGASPVLLEFQDDRDACVVYLNDFRVDPSVPGRLQSRLAEVVPLEALEVVC